MKSAQKKITGSIVIIFLLSFCLVFTSFALAYLTVSVDNNFFRTGIVKINLNDGEPVIREDEFLFEPGMTVNKEFFIENKSTFEVYYRIYFQNVGGTLADIIRVSIYDGDQKLFEGTAAELENYAGAVADASLAIMEKRTLLISFHYPETEGNKGMASNLYFDICAKAVQTKNNPDKLFE